MAKQLEIRGRRVERPFLQGGMGIGISLGGLAGAVAKEGGIGVISAAQIGFREENFRKEPQKANLIAMEREYRKAREIAGKGWIGFNIMTAMSCYRESVEKAKELSADLIISGAGLPMDLPGYVKDSPICLGVIVSTARSAEILLRYWGKKYRRMPELLIIEGPMAGGHLGFQKEQLDLYQTVGYETEIRKIMKVAKGYENAYQVPIPVILAGGIGEKSQAEEAFRLGADGIQVATRLIATWECDAHPRYKERYVTAGKEEVELIKSPVGMPGRAIANTLTKRMKTERIPPAGCTRCLKSCHPKSTPYCITEALIRAADGDIEEGLLFCGGNVASVKKMEGVKEVIASLV